MTIINKNNALDLCVTPHAATNASAQAQTPINGLPTLYQQYIHKSRYARWRYGDKRRETWPETVDRYIQHFTKQFELTDKEITTLRDSILDLNVMPSMRAMMSAGPAAERDNIAMYNCAYVVVDDAKVFSEVFYILMCGTGVGYSVERQFISKLPPLAPTLQAIDETIIVGDSRLEWAESLEMLISLLYEGHVPGWDLSLVRDKGQPLKTFGGRASGPKPLDDLFNFIVETFAGYYSNGVLRQDDDKLNSLSCHDVLCKIADVTVSGGVRRSALISLSNLSDHRMAKAKTGQWWDDNSQRALANNSVCYTEKPDFESFMAEWVNLYESKCGERGIFNRAAAKKKFASIGREFSSDNSVGVNPCSEILLNSKQLCNLSEVIVRKDDTLDDLLHKTEVAAILGTLQATQTDFKYVRPGWAENCRKEALLGVSLTGIMDHPVLSNIRDPKLEPWLKQMRKKAKEVNAVWAKRLRINASAAVTAVKPSGTVSQLANTASGIHPRYSRNYIRTVRGSKTDPITKFMSDNGVPAEDDVMNSNSSVFSFPVASDGTVFRNDMRAIEQLRHWKVYNDVWCDHKPSITVYYHNDDFLACGQWLWDNFDDVSGISFLPHSDHVYQQAPYQEISAVDYTQAQALMPKEVDWNKLSDYEVNDMTENSKTLACTGGACEL